MTTSPAEVTKEMTGGWGRTDGMYQDTPTRGVLEITSCNYPGSNLAKCVTWVCGGLSGGPAHEATRKGGRAEENQQIGWGGRVGVVRFSLSSGG